MTKAKTAWLLLGIVCLASFAMAQGTAWEKYMDAASSPCLNRPFGRPLFQAAQVESKP